MSDDVFDKLWDVVVIGAGIGGGIAGRRLAERGLSVLFVDSGPNAARDDAHDWVTDITDPEERLARGLWPQPMHGVIDGRATSFFGSIGSGVGGSSLYYAAMLERPERHDLEEVAEVLHPTGGWPVGYDEFVPYFEAAESMFEVCGGIDPLADGPAPRLREPPASSPGDVALMKAFSRRGLHPYRKHVGLRYVPGCTECFGRKCPLACKMDGQSAGVEPALGTGRAALLERCHVLALRGEGNRILHVEARRAGEIKRISGRKFVLAAGALGSPRVLLASTSETWPDGCANDSDLVGRNLMFHLNERIAIWPDRGADFSGPISAISMRDFYVRNGVRFGHVHSMGLDATYGNVLQSLRDTFDRSFLRSARPLRQLLRLPAFAISRSLGDARIFVGLLEDMPYRENRVVLDRHDPSRICFEYTVAPELLERRRAFRALIKAGLGRRRSFFINAEPELNTAHCCGTLRFGNRAQTSVIDASCRSHSVKNLYVTDASFMPTSNGVNPSLTIAANALRVADRMLASP